ncbi:MAG: DUF302 domain-containing protein [candidate division Zixibacteria bacterium]|nr:DUF302 domain-containing protein [candidate division Zixibacteria bacterium]
MTDYGYTVTTAKDIDDAVAAVEKATQDNGFRVLHIHHVDNTLRDKGIEREPYKIVEVCNAKFAAKVLEANINIGLFLPCKINVYRHDGTNYISGLRPQIMSEMFENPGIKDVADEVEGIIKEIVNSAK